MSAWRCAWGRGLLAALLLTGAQAALAFDVAVTVDDLPVHGRLPPGVTRLQIAEAHLQAFREYGVVEAFGFVNAKGAETEGEEVLVAWRRAGHPLGNHSFSHMNLGRAASLEAWQADVLAGEPLVRKHMAGADWQWFRFPNLAVGTGERRDGALAFLRSRGYRVADVSLAFSDWNYKDAYVRCKAAGDEAALGTMKAHYLRTVEAGIAHVRAESQAVYGRDIPFVLLTHMGAFGAATLSDVLQRLKAAGARFVTLAQAHADSAYERVGGGSLIAREAKARGVQLPSRPPAGSLNLETLCQ